jgi:hypothetical protein
MTNQELIELTMNLGGELLEIFSPNHECHKLIKLIIDSEPSGFYPVPVTEEYLAKQLRLTEDEQTFLFTKLNNELKLLFFNNENRAFLINYPEFETPVKGSIFVIKLNHEQTITIPCKYPFDLAIGTDPSRFFFSDLLKKNDRFVIRSRKYDMNLDGVNIVHYCEKL